MGTKNFEADNMLRSVCRVGVMLRVRGVGSIYLASELTRSEHCLFFFSSRRRHTRCSRDWSSDVCSSDLQPVQVLRVRVHPHSQPCPESWTSLQEASDRRQPRHPHQPWPAITACLTRRIDRKSVV